MLKRRPPRIRAVPLSLLALAVSLAAALSGCDSPPLYEYWDSIVLDELEISPTFLSLQEGGRATFYALGGKAPYSYEIAGDGNITPLPGKKIEYLASDGAQEAWISVLDAYGARSSARVMVAAGISILRIAPANSAIANGGAVDFSFVGGRPPYSLHLEEGLGAVEALTETTGRYSAPASGDTDAVVRLEDDSGQSSDALISVRAGPQPLAIIPNALTLEVDAPFTFGVSGGSGPYSFSVSSGAGTVDVDSGLYSSPSAGLAVVRVADAALNYADANVSVVDSAAPLEISPRSIQIKRGASFQFAAVGGVPPYSFSMASGYGGSVDAVSGVYVAPSSRKGVEKVRVADSRGISETATVKVKK